MIGKSLAMISSGVNPSNFVMFGPMYTTCLSRTIHITSGMFARARKIASSLTKGLVLSSIACKLNYLNHIWLILKGVMFQQSSKSSNSLVKLTRKNFLAKEKLRLFRKLLRSNSDTGKVAQAIHAMLSSGSVCDLHF